jgi:hypothetical protein
MFEVMVKPEPAVSDNFNVEGRMTWLASPNVRAATTRAITLVVPTALRPPNHFTSFAPSTFEVATPRGFRSTGTLKPLAVLTEWH